MPIAQAPRATQRHPKLTEAEATSVIAALEEGAKTSHLAATYGIDIRMIRAIKHRKAWDYLPRTRDFGPPRTFSRVKLDKETCERIWGAYYEQGKSARQIAEDEDISCNIVRQMLTGKSHKAMTAHLERNVEAPVVPADGISDTARCAFCASPYSPSIGSRRKTCGDACLTRLRRKPVSSHDDPAVRVVPQSSLA